jgi:hypothetical protein
MPDLAALVTASAVRTLERRTAASAPRSAEIAVYDRPAGPRRGTGDPGAAHEPPRCAECAEDRQRGPDGRWPVAVAHVELPAWCWEGYVCAEHLADARHAASADGSRCHVRMIGDHAPPRIGEVYRTVPGPRKRRTITPPREPNPYLELSGDYGR